MGSSLAGEAPSEGAAASGEVKAEVGSCAAAIPPNAQSTIGHEVPVGDRSSSAERWVATDPTRLQKVRDR